MHISCKSHPNPRQIGGKYLENIRQSHENLEHIDYIYLIHILIISDEAQAHHKHILGISLAFFWHISVKYQTTLRNISGISQVYSKCISDISQACPRHISTKLYQITDKSQGCIRHTSCIPQTYSRQISCIRHIYLHGLDEYFSRRYLIY